MIRMSIPAIAGGGFATCDLPSQLPDVPGRRLTPGAISGARRISAKLGTRGEVSGEEHRRTLEGVD
jgi:hypothetical protein